MHTLVRLAYYFKPYRIHLVLAITMMVIIALSSGAKAYLVKPVLDDIFVHKDLRMLKILPLLLLGIYLVAGLCQIGGDYLLFYIGQRIILDLRNSLLTRLLSLSMGFFVRNTTGNLISTVVNDVAQLQQALTKAISSLLKDSLTVLCLLAVVVYLNPRLTLIALLFVPFGVYLIWIFSTRIRHTSRLGQDVLARISHFLLETITGIRIVKAFGMEEYEAHRFASENKDLLRINLKVGWLRTMAPQVMEMLAIMGTASIIGYGGWQVIQGVSSPGTFFSFIAALFMLYPPINNLTNVNSLIQGALGVADRIFTLIDTVPEVREKEGAIPLPPMTDAIRFEGVSFGYGEAPVLNDIHFEVRRGEVIAIVGASGVGKTTLVSLIPRFYDVSAGRILIDGKDIREVTLRSLQSQVSIVTQHTILFNDTVRNNIAYGDITRSDEEICEAARKAGAHDFITAFPHGYGTIIGERGVRLSGGQGQRLAIARAFLKNAAILILDEATSSLDAEAEREVQHAFMYLMKGRTTFIVAHRLSTVQDADRILVLSHGRIVEEGRHEDLMKARKEYYRLYQTQEDRKGQN